jgi:hypothetical protein
MDRDGSWVDRRERGEEKRGRWTSRRVVGVGEGGVGGGRHI